MRVWGLVALFVVVVGALAVWVSSPVAEGPEPVAPSGARPPPRVKANRTVKLDPARTRVAVRDLAERHQRLQTRTEEGKIVPAGGVFPLDQNGIASAVRARATDLQGCYDTAALHTPGLSRKMTLALTIEPVPPETWGRVASVDSDVAGEAAVLESCATTVFEDLKFDAREPVVVRYPIDFGAIAAPAAE